MSAPRARPLYGIHEVAERTGLSPELIRAWERRYGLPSPERTAGGFRRYDDDDVERLRLLRELRDRGVRIAELTMAPIADLRRLLDVEHGAGPAGAVGERGPSAEPGDPAPRLVERLVRAAVAFDVAELRSGLGATLVLMPPLVAAEEVLAPFLATVGDMWERRQLPVAGEHLVTEAVRGALHALGRTGIPAGGPGAGRAVLACGPGDQHALGLLLFGLVLGGEGWDVVHLGVGMPSGEIAGAIRALGPGLVGLSFVVEAGEDEVRRTVATAAGALPEGARLLVGGRAISSLHGAVRGAGGVPCSTLGEGLERATGAG